MKYGFGAMRLPLRDPADPQSVDEDELESMIDRYMDSGYNFFDTAFPYHEGKSEGMLKKHLVERYPRDSFLLSDKMPSFCLQEREDLEKFFQLQLERCGVDHFDYYMLHNVSTWTLEALRRTGAYEYLLDLRNKGRVKHIGISIHDSAEVLDGILTEMPEVEFVLIQINYLDWENESIQSRECYEIARKHGKDIMIMEPLKGGTLADLPEELEEMLRRENPNLSPAGWALRYCLELDGVITVLSGTSNLRQLEDNLSTMKNPETLTEREREILGDVVQEINKMEAIPCTQCNYCIGECPEGIPIPTFFELYNIEKRVPSRGWSPQMGYYRIYALRSAEASDCTACGRCVEMCPQHLDIPQWMDRIVELFHNEDY